MARRILLLEPNYLNKYPPIGLMKLAAYHRILGDEVRFFKGDLKELVLDQMYDECLTHLVHIDNSVLWNSFQNPIKSFIKTGKSQYIDQLRLEETGYYFLALSCLKNYSNLYKKREWSKVQKWDRIYITTLFTFYWKVTVSTIEFSKQLVRENTDIYVGGVLASLLPNEIEQETGIRPMKGLLDKPGMLDADNDIVIDDLPLDYSILDDINYEYPTRSAYFTFMTKGCTRKCSFCSVPILEPTYKPKIETIDKFNNIKNRFGEKQNLLLMDNNVLASPRFEEIIEEIKEMGFYKGATFVEPNQLAIAIKNLEDGYNDRAFVKRSYKLIHELFKRLKNKVAQDYYNILDVYSLIKLETSTKENILRAYPLIEKTYEKYRNKMPKARYVDFNQGTDARYVTEERMKLMSEIPIRPLRIAFDYLGIKKQYINAVRLAAKYGINELSNYILYNFKDTPLELYERLMINVELSEELGINIYSFPMKYIPLFGEEAKHRLFVGSSWNRKFIRAIQSILNVTKGIVSSERTFFTKAFGSSRDEFMTLLYMPETYIVYRKIFEQEGYTKQWLDQYMALDKNEKAEAEKIIEDNNFTNIYSKTSNPKIIALLKHYLITSAHVEADKKDIDYKNLKQKFAQIIRDDQFVDLTLTYDFDDPAAREVHKPLLPVAKLEPQFDFITDSINR